MSAHPSLETGPHDPEHDPRAALKLEPAYAQSLTSRVVSSTGRSVDVSSPIDGAPLASIPQSDESDVAEAYDRARAAQPAWAAMSYAERGKVLLDLHDLILDRQVEIIDMICLESGKARKNAFDETLHVALTARYYGRTLGKHLRSERKLGAIPIATRIDLNHVPKGVVGVISPWNYPFTMALSDGIAALAAGNTVVTKPDAQTMLTALLGAQLLEDAGLPKDCWNVVAGPGRELGTPMIQRSDYVQFTGSTATGKIIATQCAELLIGCSLELGGKNPFLVLADADVDRAVEGAMRAAFGNSGQLCVSSERFYVHEDVYDEFSAKFVERTEAMHLEASLRWESDMGSLISQDQIDTAVDHTEDARSKGATVLTGGNLRTDLSPFYFEPTIMEGVTPDMKAFGDETFGPVVSLYRFSDEDEAVELANSGEYGLNGSVYTRDTARGRDVARRIKCGTVNVNEAYAATFGSIDSPMGGMRESGMGRRQGAEGILRFTESQSVATQRFMRFAPMLGMSEKQYAQFMTVSLRALKAIRRA
ncbi:succinate-semialdehyde dehydrogenase (NADP(+)) [Nocardioidaceae bacterium]|nr:succinate-semialdehyde dehydrogenase (NADP(+)) [Nocardioidaceae bacterium]